MSSSSTASSAGGTGNRIVGYSGSGGSRSSAADPQGWRALTRQPCGRIVGQGFGDLFERQINQESGYSPDVVLGARRSSAGAEGIA